MPPTVCQPKAAATRSRSPSPSKSAACTSAVRAILSTRTIFSNCRGAVWRSHTMLPFSWSPGMKSPRSAISRSCFPSLSRSTISAWSGFGMLAITRSSPGFFAGLAEHDEAVAHVAGHDLQPAVAVEVEEAHVGHDGDLRPLPAGSTAWCAKRSPPSPGGQGSGRGRLTGARASKYRTNCAVSICHRTLSSPGVTPVPMRLRWAISWMRRRHMPRGRYWGCGGTWHFEHCFWIVSTKAASGSVSGLPSRPRMTAPAGGAGACAAPKAATNGRESSRRGRPRRSITRPVYNAGL